MKANFILSGIIGGAFAWSVAARAAENPVFQIGTQDANFAEFALAGHYQDYPNRFPHDANFVVGQSDPSKDWPYVLPGPDDLWAGSKTHTLAIHFQISELAANYYELVVDFVGSHYSDPPVLAVEINGERVEQRLPAGKFEDVLIDARLGKPFAFRQVIPATLLRQGDNTIALTSAEGSWAIFDDVRLEGNAPAPEADLTMEAEPLPFFKKTPDGLQRAMNVSIEYLAGRGGPAELAWTARTQSGSLPFDLHFGANQVMITVADVDQVDLTLKTAQKELKTPVMLPPSRKWQIYVVPSAHTDIGYTDFQERVKARHAENGLKEVQWLKQYPFMKWNSETYWQLNAFLELHPEKRDELFALMRAKRWNMSASYANMLTGLCSHEALDRYTLDAHNLARAGGFDLDYLILDDVPSAVGSLPMIMANSGIKYFIEGSNKDRAPHVGNGLKNPFYWEGADGSRVLSYISYNPGYGVTGDLVHTVRQGIQRLPAYLARFETAGYPYDAVVLNGSYSDNGEVELWLPKVIEQWNAEWAYPQLIPSSPSDFLGYIEKNYSNSIPVLKTDFGGWWEDGTASSARETVLDRRAEERIVTAEMLHSLASLLTGAVYPKTNLDAAWDDALLYDEHTWGAFNSISEPDGEQAVHQWKIKAAFAQEADAQSRNLLDSGMAELAGMVPAADLVVFNSLAWSRQALVNTELSGAVKDVATQKIYPCQALPEGGNCFLADALPSIGYRTYQHAAAGDTAAPEAAQIVGSQIENEFYRVVLNPKTGGIQSIYDKETGRELVDTNSESDLGELIYVTGGEGTYAIHSDLTNLPPPKFEYHWQTGTGISQTNGPVFGELVSRAAAENFPGIALHVRLYHGLKRLDLIYDLDKTETTEKEAVYLSFPFALDTRKGGLWLEYPDEITEPLTDQHTSACRDWYSVQRWLAESDGDTTLELSPLDTPLFTLGHMTASTWPRELSLERGHVYAYVMNNYWHTNYKARQGGHFTFRFSLTSRAGAFSKHDAVVSGWNMYCPPVAAQGQGEHQAQLADPAGSLIGVAPSGLPLTAFKRAEADNDFVFRLCDFAGEGGTATLTLPRAVSGLASCNLVEENVQSMDGTGKTVTVPIKPFGPVTVKVSFVP